MSEKARLLSEGTAVDDDSMYYLQSDETTEPLTSGTTFMVFTSGFLILLLLFNSVLFFANYRVLMHSKAIGVFRPYSPAQEAATYLIKNEHATDHSVYSSFSGPPNDENIKAWEDLIEPTFFSTTADEISKSDDTVHDSVKLAEGGYVAALGVYHEIHCLRQLRMFLYPEHFYPNITKDNIEYLQGHLDHCIETLRLSLICAADISLYTFRWDDSDPNRPHPKSKAKR